MTFSTYFEEHEDSPMESGNRAGQLDFKRIFLTAWADRWSFLSELYTSGPFGLPASYSTFWPGVLADQFNITRLVNAPEQQTMNNPNSQLLSHDTVAKLTIQYTPLDPGELDGSEEQQTPDGTWATYNQQSNIEFLSLTPRAMVWDSDDVALPADFEQILPQSVTTHVVTWQQVRNVPWVTLGNTKGKVNSAITRLPGSPQLFAPETLLFEGFDDEVTLSLSAQQTTRKLTLRFTEKAQHFLESGTSGGAGSGTIYGWNHQYREDTDTYDKPVNKGTDDTLFQTIDFNNLWLSTT